MSERVQIGIIGGSGLNKLDFLENPRSVCETKTNTIYDNIIFGTYLGIPILFTPRHGFQHEYSPSKVPYHAIMCALKCLGCTHIIATTAVMSLNTKMIPGDFVIIHSFIDGTECRHKTFYQVSPFTGDEALLPKYLCKSFSKGMSKIIKTKADTLGIPCHSEGVVMTVEGPRFPSQVESKIYSDFGADVLNFTTVPEVLLAREMMMHYVVIAMVTDIDPVFDMPKKGIRDIIAIFQTNTENMKKILANAVPEIMSKDWTEEREEIEILEQRTHTSGLNRGLYTKYTGMHEGLWSQI